MSELVVELFAGKTVERDQLIRDCVRVHSERGGKRARSINLAASGSKALKQLRAKGMATNVSMGFWRIGSELQAAALPDTISAAPDTPYPNEAAQNGSGSVYLYYLPLYRQNAERDGKEYWPCKIGKSGRDPLERILSQAATALPEIPEVPLVFDTEQASALETALHAILTLRNKRIDGAPGNEWFLTSPKEVIAIVASIDPSIKQRG